MNVLAEPSLGVGLGAFFYPELSLISVISPPKPNLVPRDLALAWAGAHLARLGWEVVLWA